MNKKIKKLALSAVMLALAIVLSHFTKIIRLPWGGSVTLMSMLPIIIVSIKYGCKWGVGCGFCFSFFQILEGGVFGWGLTPAVLIGSLLLDYILPYTVIGFAGLFRKKGYGGYLLGTVAVCCVRFLSHFASGIILWKNVEQFVVFGTEYINRPVFYSLIYNGSYMLPELIITVIGAAVIFRIKQMQKLLAPEL